MRDTRFSTLSTFLFLGVNIQKIKKSIMMALMKIGYRSICRDNIHKEGFRLLISLTFAEDVKSDVWKIQIFLTREPIMASPKREIGSVAKFLGLMYTVLSSIQTFNLFYHYANMSLDITVKTRWIKIAVKQVFIYDLASTAIWYSIFLHF